MAERRVKATRAQKKATRKASKAIYEQMRLAATEVVMRNRGMEYRSGEPVSVLMEFPFWVTFTRGFPKGHIVAKTLSTNVHKVNAVKLLNWLHENGYSTYNASKLVQETKQYEYLNNEVERLFE
jgi:hypothetical protein